MVNGPTRCFIEVDGKIQLTNVRFRDNGQLMNICQRIVSQVGRRVDESSPICDARLLDGSRVNVIAPPLSIDGVALTIRKFRKDKLTLDQLVRFGSISPPAAEMLKIIGRVRCNVLISGGTGSGKTTLLNCLTRFIDQDERVVTCEDAAELQLQQSHVVRLETRPANLEGAGQITMRDLVRNCLRMRPERIIVGEVRGPEAFDLLQAMNTGHDGSMGTLHANSPREALSRIESMISMGGYTLPVKTVREMIASSIDVIIQAARLRDGSRRITHITEVVGMEGDVITTQDLIVYDIIGEDAQGKLKGRHRSTGIGRPRFWERARVFNEEQRLAAALDASEAEGGEVMRSGYRTQQCGPFPSLLARKRRIGCGQLVRRQPDRANVDANHRRNGTSFRAPSGLRATFPASRRRRSRYDQPAPPRRRPCRRGRRACASARRRRLARRQAARRGRAPGGADRDGGGAGRQGRAPQADRRGPPRPREIEPQAHYAQEPDRAGGPPGHAGAVPRRMPGLRSRQRPPRVAPMRKCCLCGARGRDRWAGLPQFALKALRKRRISKFIESFPNAIDIIVRGVKSGLPLGDTIRIAANESEEPVRGEFRKIVQAMTIGLTLPEAVERMAQRVPVAETNFFAIVIAIQGQAGGNLSEALGNLSKVLRERKKMKAKIGAMSMEAKASAVIIGLVPFLVVAALYVSSPNYVSALWTTTHGRLIAGIALAWMSVGVAMMKKMVAFDI